MSVSDTRQLGRKYAKGELIFRQGDLADALFVVQQGEVELFMETSANPLLLEVLGAGEMFGETSLFTADKSRYFSARALKNSSILKLDEKSLMIRLHTDPSLSFRLLRHMAQHLYTLDRHRIESLRRGKRSKESRKENKRPALLNVHDFSVGHHLLVVEDDPVFFAMVEGWLTDTEALTVDPLLSGSFCLTHVESFQEAVQKLGQEKFNLVLLDLHLPDSKGIETFFHLYDLFPDTPFVVLTSLDDQEKALQAVRFGAQDYLLKGQVNSQSLNHSVHYALERHRFRSSDREVDTIGEEYRLPEPELHRLGLKNKFVSWFRNQIE
ncbi:MAG: cyclic nucleotide-binding domain-containing protein [Magnetococcus sp. DMHC-6]